MRARSPFAIVASMSASNHPPDPLDPFAALSGRRVLVVGGRRPDLFAAALERGAFVWGIDDSPTRLAASRDAIPDVDLRLGRLDDLPFDSNTFDVVLATRTVSPAGASMALDEIVRVCRRQGVVVLHGDGQTPRRDVTDSRY